MQEHILIIDDDLELTALIKKFLENNKFKVSSFDSPKKALERLSKNNTYDLIILDIMMPEMDGFQVLREVEDRIVGLELGADDYMPKPFEPEELTARIQSILRRINSPETMIDNLEFEHLSIDKLKQEVILNGDPVSLSTTEFEALLIFAENCGQILDRDFLVENLRGISWQSYDRSIDVLVSRLRNKLSKLDPDTEYIKTIHGVGYKFIDRVKK